MQQCTEAGSYLVLSLNFSRVNPANVEYTFHNEINSAIERFSAKYVRAGLLTSPIKIDQDSFYSLDNLESKAKHSGHEVFVIIDDMDSYLNRALLQSEPTQAGLKAYKACVGNHIRTFCDNMKASNVFSRLFFTGMVPVSWIDMHSCLNDVLDLSYDEEFRGLLGLTEEDVRRCMKVAVKPYHKDLDEEKHLEVIRNNFNVFRCSPDQERGMYNNQDVWYYLRSLQTTQEPPKPLYDPNQDIEPTQLVHFIKNHPRSKCIIDYHSTNRHLCVCSYASVH